MKRLLLLFIPIIFVFGCEKKNHCVSKLDPDCAYIKIWNPVCGCDGITYSNYNHAFCNNILTYTNGECLK